MLFVPPKAPAAPTEPGCYVWMATECTQQRTFSTKLGWKRDTWGEEQIGASHSEAACESRKATFDTWCGTTSAEMRFVPPALA